MEFIIGIIRSALTDAQFSDRTGRRNLFLVTAFGAMCANTVYLLVNRYWRVMPTGYWSVLLGPLIEGSLGGMPAAVMAFISYVSDTTQERDRSVDDRHIYANLLIQAPLGRACLLSTLASTGRDCLLVH